jgi:predicted dehydrogenase
MSPLRWGVLGAGTVSRHFASSLRLLPDAEVVSVASRTPASARRLAAELGIPGCHETYEALLADPRVDAVYVATPAALHRDHCLLSLAAGKAVLCEKPFALDAAQAREVAEGARRRGLFCMEAMWMRFIPAIRDLRERVRGGDIGEVVSLEAELRYPVPMREGSRHHDPALGGGALLDLGIYPLSLAFHLLGAPSALVARATFAPTGVDDQASVLLSYPRALASLSCGFVGTGRNGATVIGTRGAIEVEPPIHSPHALTITRWPEAGPAAEASGVRRALERLPLAVELRRRLAPRIRPLIRRNRTRVAHHFRGFGYQFEAAEAMRCIRAGLTESPVMPLDESVAILEAMDEIRRSIAVRP